MTLSLVILPPCCNLYKRMNLKLDSMRSVPYVPGADKFKAPTESCQGSFSLWKGPSSLQRDYSGGSNKQQPYPSLSANKLDSDCLEMS